MNCSSPGDPRVVTVKACVSPRVNTALPCVLGSSPTRQEMWRISVNLRPSGRFSFSKIFWCTISSETSSKTCSAISLSRSIFSGYFPLMTSLTFSLMTLMRSSMIILSLSYKISLRSSCMKSSLTSASNSGVPANKAGAALATPNSLVISSMRPVIFLMASCPKANAFTISSSGTSFMPASIMLILSAVPAIIKSMSPSTSSPLTGLRINSPFTRPTRTAPIGPFQGILENDRAAEAAIIETMAGSFSPSMERTVITTCTSLRMRALKSGLMVRSTTRPVSTASSDGRPSRLMKREPLILPAA